MTKSYKGDDYGDWLYDQKVDRELDRKLDEPWNNWMGLHEGDMCVELAELDAVLLRRYQSDPEGAYREALDHYQNVAKSKPETVRKLWWLSIGRHTTEGTKDEV